MADRITNFPGPKVASDTLTAIIEDGCKDPNSQAHGFVLQVVDRNGSILNHTASGVRSMESKVKMTTDSAFWVASCTKMVTAVAFMQLHEQGRAPLDNVDKLEEVCPELKNVKILENGEWREKNNCITLGMLMTHTSGFSYSLANEDIWKNEYNHDSENDEFANRTSSVLNQSLVFEPGTGRSYGISIDWVGVYIERVTGQSLAEYEEQIFKPLGMTSTAFIPSRDMASRMVTLQHRSQDYKSLSVNNKHPFHPARPDYIDTKYYSGGGGLFSTADDFCKIIAALLNDGLSPTNGSRILRRESIDLMFSNQIVETGSKSSGSGFTVAREDICFPWIQKGVPMSGPTGNGLDFGLYGDERLKNEVGKKGVLFPRAGGKQAYRLRLPVKYSRIHNVFHVSLLELYYRRAGETPDIHQPDLLDGEEVWKVEDLLDRRIIRGKEQYLVRWQGFGPADDASGPVENLVNCEERIKALRRRDAAQTPAKGRLKA